MELRFEIIDQVGHDGVQLRLQRDAVTLDLGADGIPVEADEHGAVGEIIEVVAEEACYRHLQRRGRVARIETQLAARRDDQVELHERTQRTAQNERRR